MRARIRKILVTGAAGFIGSAFVRLLLKRGSSPQGYHRAMQKGLSLIVVDKLTYSGDLKRLAEVEGKYKFYKADICNKRSMSSIIKKEKPDVIMNFSAETHVDRSILDSTAFLKTNVMGTQVLLDLSRKHKIKKFIHLSSDEVYGEIKKGKFSEEDPLKPNSPYAASKAAADLLIKAYLRTYGIPAIIIRPSNNYGPWQYPEKLIPLAILKILKGEKVPVYADGKNVREWLFVEDCARGILQILKKGKIGEVYNLGSGQEKQNIETVKLILKFLKKDKRAVQFVRDRPGHDIRYSLNSSKALTKIGWRPKINFETGLKLTVSWYLGHREWLLSKKIPSNHF